jgi:hypothetical protein
MGGVDNDDTADAAARGLIGEIGAGRQAPKDISDKVRVLIKILNESYEKNDKTKTIIFVKDRSVAFYLKKILRGSCLGQESR